MAWNSVSSSKSVNNLRGLFTVNALSRRSSSSVINNSDVIVISITVSVAESGDGERQYFLHSQAHHTLLTDVRKCVYERECRCTYTCGYVCVHACA